MIVFLDIETIPNWEREVLDKPPRPTKEDVKVGNRKNDTAEMYREEQLPILIDKWNNEVKAIENKEEEIYRKYALTSYKCKIICIGYCIVGTEHVVGEIPEGINHIVGEEEDIINSLGKVLSPLIRHECLLVGQNVWFDLSIIRLRAALYNNTILKRIIPTYKYDKRVADISQLFSNNEKYISLDNMCKFFGLKGKGDMDGSKVFDAWNNGEIKKIAEYCDGDVFKTMEIYNRLC